MKLQTIQIKNYRSIYDILFNINSLSSDKTYSLIGINEAGKSSILKAISLKDGLHEVTHKDFYEKDKPIEVKFKYQLETEDFQFLKNQLKDSETFGNEKLPAFDFKEVILTSTFEYTSPASGTDTSEILTKHSELKRALDEIVLDYLIKNSHEVIYWVAEPKFLISEPINLTNFAANPEQISVPLKNCFALSGFTDIPKTISELQNDPTEIESLQNVLGREVTAHIRQIWPNHPIQISFIIHNNSINFLIKDEGVEGKSKTVDQRSDGFKQFVSFLLTISAQNKNEELVNSLILLDEPETHLHPKGQEYLKDELIKLSKNKTGNVVMYATHSNYMIDKKNLSRSFKVVKEGNKTTNIEQFTAKDISYSEVNYEVFDIATPDYHNELYGSLQEDSGHFNEKDFETWLVTKKLVADKEYTKVNKDKTLTKYKVTLPTKIRNIIHHPENSHNKYSEEDLRKSIESLRSIKYKYLKK